MVGVIGRGNVVLIQIDFPRFYIFKMRKYGPGIGLKTTGCGFDIQEPVEKMRASCGINQKAGLNFQSLFISIRRYFPLSSLNLLGGRNFSLVKIGDFIVSQLFNQKGIEFRTQPVGV